MAKISDLSGLSGCGSLLLVLFSGSIGEIDKRVREVEGKITPDTIEQSKKGEEWVVGSD